MNILKRFILSFIVILSVPIFVNAQDDNETCLTCHDDSELTGLNRNDEEVSMYVSQQMLNKSVHADLNCVDCHIDLQGVEDFPHSESLLPVDCGNCHEDVQKVFNGSAHAEALKDKLYAPTCSSCHGTHEILTPTNPDSPTSKKNMPFTCAHCHNRQMKSKDPDIKMTTTTGRYMKGIHAQGIARGIGSAASCEDCHGIHDLKKASNVDSKTNKMNIPKTCSKCHYDIYIQYSRGIHGKALQAGILDSPNCSDCHGEHEILGVDDPNSPVNNANLSDYVCGRCHNDPVLAEKYGIGKDRFTSYQDTYHGLAIHGGSIKAATCASCHRAHDILPASNPASSINPNNLTKTCQKCHIDANDSFAQSYTHNSREDEFAGVNGMITNIYIVLIVLVIGGMLAHNFIILARYFREKKKRIISEQTVRRLDGNLIFQHMVITITFIVLVITGMALRYSNAWWVGILNFFGIFEGSRSIIHRIAAVLMVYISVHHVLYIIMSRRGKRLFKEILPNKDDIVQIKQNMMFYLGLSKEKPNFGFYDYTEKAEYWALVWGTIVMVFTGTVLWFPTFYTSFLPAWIVSISETVHFYEAWLATLAIAVFHFFFVIFHPEQYPMSFSWLNGKITVEEMKHHHPAWYKEEFGENGDKEKIKKESDSSEIINL